MIVSADACAEEVLEAVPAVMRFIRREVRGHRGSDLSVPQFRALLHIRRNAGTSLSALADHLGLTPATTSSLVDGLVRRQMVCREPSTEDRRRLALGLSPVGRRAVDVSMAAAQQKLASKLQLLQAEELQSIQRGLAALRRTFDPAQGAQQKKEQGRGNR